MRAAEVTEKIKALSPDELKEGGQLLAVRTP
jgi:hypothetical protein